LPTPTTVQTDEPPEKMRAMAERNGYKNGTKFGSLTSQIKYDERLHDMWTLPTPAARDWKGCTTPGVVKESTGTAYGETVPDAVARLFGNLLPTPQMQDYNTGISQEAKVAKLERYKDKGVIPSGTYMLRQMAIEGKLPKPDGMNVPETDGGNTSRLSPLFTEEMMGFPLMWTALPFLSESGEQKASKPTATQ
jgi:hypothetical protein